MEQAILLIKRPAAICDEIIMNLFSRVKDSRRVGKNPRSATSIPVIVLVRLHSDIGHGPC